jgi:hypothetical protein
MAAGAHVTLTNGATASHVFWQVTGAASVGANATFVGTIMAQDAGNPGSFTQRLTIDTVPPVVSLDGGPSVTTNNTKPTIAGTSDAAPGTVVRVTVGSQTLTALVQSGGTWNVTATALADGTRTVTAAVTDPAGNQSTVSQALTVNTAAPAVTISGGANALTNDATPVISGTANVALGTTVTVTLADQTLTGLVRGGGAWSATAAALSDGPHRVIMSVSDAVGNRASFMQTLTVDTVAPSVAIAGGAKARTTNHAPTIAGTSDAAPGTTVTISIAGQTMTTLVQVNGRWNATPAFVGTGTWLVVASAPDPAGNVGRARQTLTIATDASSGSGGTGSRGARQRLTVSLSASQYRATHGKRVQVSFVLSGPAKLTLTVVRGKRVVAQLSTMRRKAGHGSFTWDGKINRTLAARGAYKIMVRAVSSAGASARDAATVRIT